MGSPLIAGDDDPQHTGEENGGEKPSGIFGNRHPSGDCLTQWMRHLGSLQMIRFSILQVNAMNVDFRVKLVRRRRRGILRRKIEIRFPRAVAVVVASLTLLGVGVGGLAAQPAVAEPPGGALAGERFRVIVSTDIGGSDPDDFQSMVHYLVYADRFDTEGLIASPPHAGRTRHLLEVLDAYETDYPQLLRHSDAFPEPDALRAVTKQGAADVAPSVGYSRPTEGSRRIIDRAHADDPRPLWVLVWGSITDVAQALHDDPSIKSKLRVYSIGSWNTRQDPAARDYIHREHPDLWFIESDTTFRGMYVGGNQQGDLGNREFIARHVKGHGALGDLLAKKKADIKMGDTPSVLYLLRGDADDPTADHWGGSFMATDHGPRYWTDDPDPELAQGPYPGAKTVNRWREDYLRDWQRRMRWLRD